MGSFLLKYASSIDDEAPLYEDPSVEELPPLTDDDKLRIGVAWDAL